MEYNSPTCRCGHKKNYHSHGSCIISHCNCQHYRRVKYKRANNRLHTDAGESTVKMGYLTPEEDAVIKADNKPAHRG